MSSIVQTNPVITGIGGAAKIGAVLTSTSKRRMAALRF